MFCVVYNNLDIFINFWPLKDSKLIHLKYLHSHLQDTQIDYWHLSLEFFANSLQCKNANLASFVSAMPLEIDYTNWVYNLEIYFAYTHWPLIYHLLTSYGVNNEGNCKYMGIQSWQNCQSCVFVKNPIVRIAFEGNLSGSHQRAGCTSM